MEQLFAQNPWLVLLGAVLVGMLIMWMLEMFVLRRNVKSNLTELESSVKQRDSELQTVQATLKESNSELKSKGAELQTVTAARAAADKQVADLSGQLNKTTADLNAAQQTRQQLETTLNTRTTELNEQRAKLAALTTQANDAAAQVQALSGERDQLRAGLDTAQAELTDNKAHYRGALSEVAKLTATAAATAAVVKGLEASKSDLTTEIEKLKTAKAGLETELAETKTRVSDLEGVSTALEGQVSELEGRNSALDADVTKLTAGALAAAAVIKQLEGDKEELTTAHTALGQEFESLQRIKALDDADLAELKLQLNKVNEALGITMRDKETYQETLATRVDELGKAQTQLIQAKEDNSNLLGDVAKFTARAATAAVLVQELEGRKRNLSEQVEQLRGELDAERQRTASLTQPETPAQKVETPEPPLAVAAAASTLAAAATAEPHHADAGLTLETVCPQDMSSVRGVGPDFEQRLYNAGIGTYWDLSQKGEDELADILGLDKIHQLSVNLAAIRGEALRLARETKTQKRTWKGGTPDDFDRISGLGRVYEGRLYEAGICTFEALAGSTVEQLVSICRSPNHDHSHYQSWIDQANALVQSRREGL